ncbi:MAG: lipoyl(octanoyl) transferase LipB [Pseudomonadota bacterium]|nr:lipoyl(octanoyl) transferase LipB [Pseudomonadota bacterium]
MPEWRTESGLVDYAAALQVMEQRVADISAGKAGELVWLLQHPPLYTAGTSAQDSDLLSRNRFPVYQTGRGGQYTYHGPGQRVAYIMLDLKKCSRGEPDLRAYVYRLEEWLIRTLGILGVQGERREGRVGIWVSGAGEEAKIAALGVRVRHWVTYHGVALNVDPDLGHFDGIVPCGVRQHGVTSLRALGLSVSMDQADMALKQTWSEVFEKD